MENIPQEPDSFDETRANAPLNHHDRDHQPQLEEITVENMREMTDNQALSIIQQWENDQSSEHIPVAIDEMAESLEKWMENIQEENHQELVSIGEARSTSQPTHFDGNQVTILNEVQNLFEEIEQLQPNQEVNGQIALRELQLSNQLYSNLPNTEEKGNTSSKFFKFLIYLIFYALHTVRLHVKLLKGSR